MMPNEKEWFWRMDWLKSKGLSPASQFNWLRAGNAYKEYKENKTDKGEP